MDELSERFRSILNDPPASQGIHGFEDEEECNNPDKIGDDSDMLHCMKLLYYSTTGKDLFIDLEDRIYSMERTVERFDAARDILHQDIEKYDINPLESLKSGSVMHVKADIYRYPSLLVLDLKIFLNINSSSPWETISLLTSVSDQVPERLEPRLSCLLAVSMLIRLASYLHHDKQCERISLLKSSTVTSPEDSRCSAVRFWHMPSKLFLLYYIVMQPVKDDITHLTSHGTPTPETDEGQERVANGFYATIALQNFDGAIGYLSHVFKENTPGSSTGYQLLTLCSQYILGDYNGARSLVGAVTEQESRDVLSLLDIDMTQESGCSPEIESNPDVAEKVENSTVLINVLWKEAICGQPLIKVDLNSIAIDENTMPDYIVALNHGRLCFLKSDYTSALEYFADTRKLLENTREQNTVIESESWLDSAFTYEKLGDYEKACECYSQTFQQLFSACNAELIQDVIASISAADNQTDNVLGNIYENLVFNHPLFKACLETNSVRIQQALDISTRQLEEEDLD